MKKSLLAFAAITAAVFVAVTGCETEKLSDKQLSISPAKATVAPGQSLVLTAEGGWDYTWEILEPRYGTLSSYNGKQVTYYAPEASSITRDSITSNFGSTNGFELTEKIQVHSASNRMATAIILIQHKEKGE
jgi:hypothetical protein